MVKHSATLISWILAVFTGTQTADCQPFSSGNVEKTYSGGAVTLTDKGTHYFVERNLVWFRGWFKQELPAIQSITRTGKPGGYVFFPGGRVAFPY
jgi:hypothetical protein